jgi:hypothetical protein
VVMTKRVKFSRAFASMAMGRRMRPESTMPSTADRLRPNPVVSSFSTRMDAGSSNRMTTSSGAWTPAASPDRAVGSHGGIVVQEGEHGQVVQAVVF